MLSKSCVLAAYHTCLNCIPSCTCVSYDHLINVLRRGLSQISNRGMSGWQLMCPRHSQSKKLNAGGHPEINGVAKTSNRKCFKFSTLNSQMAAGLPVFRLSFTYLHFTSHESIVCQLQPAKLVVSVRVYSGIIQHQVWPEILQNS